MSICRTCLAESAEKDIKELKVEETSSFTEVFLFCLDIKIPQEDSMSTKLCLKCYRNLLSFYKFKSLAQKNDVYWKTLKREHEKNEEVLTLLSSNKIKAEQEEPEVYNFVSFNNGSDNDCDSELNIKCETVTNLDSEDELLSVIKSMKTEKTENSEETKEKEPIKRKYKKRGRPKKPSGPAKKPSAPVEQVCEECGKTVRNLKEHMARHQPISERRRLKCKFCDKTFATQSSRSKHNRTKHLGIKKKCPICNKVMANLWAHMKRHNPSRLEHKCEVCERRFISRSILAAHMALHTAARAFQCDICEKGFNTKIVMLQHRRQVHDKEKSHLCQICSKSFFKKQQLQVHLRSHTKERPYECNICGKFFISTSTLKNHKIIHDSKLYECEQCDMTFRSPNYLRAHMKSHSKVKNHPCKYCGVKFGRSDHKKRHERTAHERHLATTTEVLATES